MVVKKKQLLKIITNYDEKNHLTKYIKVLGKQNKSNTYPVCIGCYEIVDIGELNKYRFINKKQQVKNHLKNCDNFLNKIGSKEVDEIINLTDNEDEDSIKNNQHKAIVDLGKKNNIFQCFNEIF